MSTNDDLLQKLRKLISEESDTADNRQPWQELFGRNSSVPSRAVRAAEAVRGFAGSWAASYTIQDGHTPNFGGDVTPVSGFDYQLGKRGYPEINFVPYDWNTNRFGSKGPSLVGHPVSFQVVGPTHKRLVTPTNFEVDLADNKIVVPAANFLSLYGNVDPQQTPTWVLVTEPGGKLTNVNADHRQAFSVMHGLTETPKHRGTARYELFRIESIEGSTISLSQRKRLDEYFLSFAEDGDTSTPPAAKSIMLLQPNVARLAPILDSDNKTFVVVPPSRSSVGEYQESYQHWVADNGLADDFNKGSLTPIPKPLPLSGSNSKFGEFRATMNSVDIYLGNTPKGRFLIAADGNMELYKTLQAEVQSNGALIHISEVTYRNTVSGGSVSSEDSELFRNASFTGYFEVVSCNLVGPDLIIECREQVTVDPDTGVPTQLQANGYASPTGTETLVRCTVHSTVSSLFDSDLDRGYADDLEASRITGIIDPNEVGRSVKVHGTNDVPVGGYSGRADRAIPSTQLGTDPGSLLDLGFRMVFFTGHRTVAGAEILVDWENPIASNEALLDPSITDERQYIDVDYAAGIVKFSHTPTQGGDFVLDNEGRPIVYAAFIPYSMEGGQRSVGVRMTGGDLLSANMGYPHAIQRDVFSKEEVFSVQGSQSVSWGGDLHLSYEGKLSPFPPTGSFTFAKNKTGFGGGALPYVDTHTEAEYEIFLYDGVVPHPTENKVTLRNVRSNQQLLGAFAFDAPSGVLLRHRPDIKSLYDRSYGSSARSDVVRLAYGDVSYNEDGSMTVMPTAVAGPAEELRAFFPLGNLTGNVSEIGRFHLDPDTQRWSTNDPPWYKTGHDKPALQTNEIGIEVSRGRLYTNWEFTPETEVNVRRVYGLASSIDPHLQNATKPLRESFTIKIPADPLRDIDLSENLDRNSGKLLSARIEGASIRSKTLAGSKGEAGQIVIDPDVGVTRFVFGMFDERNTPAKQNSPVEACRRVQIVEVESGSNTTMEDLANSVLGASLPTMPSGQTQFAVTGRQVFAFPAKPYLASRSFQFPMDYAATLRSIIDLRSVTPITHDVGSAWLHTEFVVEHPDPAVPVTFGDANEMALYFNEKSIYNSVFSQQLKDANFHTRGQINDDLILAGWEEFPIAWIGPNDDRYPSSLDGTQIALIFTGLGEMQRGPEGKSLPFASRGILCELDSTTRDLKGTEDLLTAMGGDFTPEVDPHKPQARFGGVGYNGSLDLDDGGNTASGNHENLGFPIRGTRPLGRFVGSFKIKSFETNSDDSTGIEAYYPTGASSDWYNDQSSSGFEGNLSGHGMVANHRWQGRLSFPLHTPYIIQREQVGQVAGITEVFVTFGVDQFNENRDKNNPLPNPIHSNPSELLEVTLRDQKEWAPPHNVWKAMSFGDLVSVNTETVKADGRLLWKSPTPNKFSVLCGIKEGLPFFLSGTEVGSKPVWAKNSSAQRFGPTGAYPRFVTGSVSVTPSTISGVEAAVAHFMRHDAAQTKSDEFLSGYASNVRSSVLIGSGRVSMLSSLGNLEPTGIALHNLINASGKAGSGSQESLNKSSVYIESGAFTTLGGGDSRGYWQSFSNFPNVALPDVDYPNPSVKKSLDIGGVGGVRISGDAHLWLKSIQQLRSSEPTALVLESLESPLSGLSQAPSASLPHRMTTLVPGTGMVVQEATVEIGLTQADLKALEGLIAKGASLTKSKDDTWTGDETEINAGVRMFQMGQMAVSSLKPLFMPSLVGNYIGLTEEFQTHGLGISNIPNTNIGMWRIVGAPMVVRDTKAFGQHVSGSPHNKLTTDEGRNRESQVVAVMAIRIEGLRTLNENEFEGSKGFGKPYKNALHWGVYRDSAGHTPVFTGDVVDPGGAPTGAPASLRGLTLDPQIVAGKSYLPAEIIPVFDSISGDFHTEDFTPSNFSRSGVELLGVHDQIGRLGKHFSRAFFSARASIGQEMPKVARMVVLADEAGLVDGVPTQEFNGEINVDGKTGRVDYLGYPRRLGPGVIMDGGLGMVQANSFRSRPRPTHVEYLGKLMVWGRGAYPLQNGLTNGNIGSELPSVLNTTEFHGEISVANPTSRIVFESPRAAEGVAANMLASEFMTSRHRGSTHFAHYVSDKYVDPAISSNEYTEDPDSIEFTILQSVVVTDTIFPHVSSGAVFRAPGTTVYERAFRSLDSTGSNPYRKSSEGTHNRGGIPGLGVPTHGEVLLLPQGPSALGKRGRKFMVGTVDAEGKTPSDAPLYSFVNGPAVSQMVDGEVVPFTSFTMSPFGINLLDVIGAVPNISHANAEDGTYNHYGQMGSVSQAYRHSNSREDALFEEPASKQVRLLDGMVIEDITNGTFYTAGSVGRDFPIVGASTGLGLPGNGVRSPVNGSITVSGSVQLEGTTSGGTAFPLHTLPEAVYDIGPHFDPQNPVDSTTGFSNGFGDRVDSGVVRRPLTGHEFRITPNVEFVPVLGERGVTGGIIPPIAWSPNPQNPTVFSRMKGGNGTDAFFYDLTHTFKEDDIGKMLYLCGTNEYALTGWWVITDVVSSPALGLYAHPDFNCGVSSLAALRKFNWGDRNEHSPIPMREGMRPIQVVSTADFTSNSKDGRGHFATPGATQTYDDVYITVTNANGETVVQGIPKGDMLPTVWTAADAAHFLNNDPRSNGQNILHVLNNSVGVPTDYSPVIRWEARAETLVATFWWKYGNLAEAATLRSGLTTFQVYWRTRTDGVHDVIEGADFIGFGYSKAHNLGAVRAVGDANNALEIAYRHEPSKFDGYKECPARGIRWVFSHPLTEENMGSYVHLTKPRIYRFSSGLPASQTLPVPYVYDSKWMSGHARQEDILKTLDLSTDIFRINRCPTTAKAILGGDCEVFHPEMNIVHKDATKGRLVRPPVMYSPLSVHGNWQDTDTGNLPQTGSLNFPVMYALQPIAREKIVTISPTNAKSSVVFARGLGDELGVPQGPQGVGPAVAIGHGTPNSPTASFVMEPFQLVSRADMSRTSMAQSAMWNFDGRVELNNANLETAPVTMLLGNATSNLTMAQKLHADAQANIQAYSANITALTALYGDIVQEIIANPGGLAWHLQDTWADIQAAYATAQGQIAAVARATWLEMESDKNALLAELHLVNKAIATIQDQIHFFEVKIVELEAAIAALGADKADLEVAITNKLTEKADLETLLVQEETLLHSANMSYQEHVVIVAHVYGQIQAYDANFDFDADYDGHDTVLKGLVSDYVHNIQGMRAATQAIQFHEEKIAELQFQISSTDDVIATLSQKIDSTTIRIEDMTVAVQTAQGKIVDLGVPYDSDYNNALLLKMQSVDWWDVFTDDLAVWTNDFGLKLRSECYAFWLTTADADIASAEATMLAADLAAGLSPLLALFAKLRDQIEALMNQAADYLDDISDLQNSMFFGMKERDYQASRQPHLQGIVDYWQSAIDTSVLGNKLEVATPSTYMWTPAGEWWQLYQPAWDQHGPDASAPPPTLKIDLTDSFTQAVGPGSGQNTPHPNRFPRGVRLNRLWVNFGMWGNDIFGTGGQPSRRAFNTPGFPEGVETGLQSRDMVLDQMYMTFNLVLEIPGSQARVMVDGQDHDPHSGSAGFPMGGRMPTAATNHSDNGNSEVFPGGTIVVPLYVNREAGDLMPNVMERFVTVGPMPDPTTNQFGKTDWSGGDYEFGFGCSHNRMDDPSYFAYKQAWLGSWDGSQSHHAPGTMFVNSFNPVVWGGMDYAPLGDTQNDGVFDSPRFARAQSSIFPRSSSMGGGLRSAFTSGLIPDGQVFSNTDPHSLSAATLTGITIAHSGQMPIRPRACDGTYTDTNTRGGQTSPHGFTIALTPVGDAHKPYLRNNTTNRLGMDPHLVPPNTDMEFRTAHYGRSLENPVGFLDNSRPFEEGSFKVGNWLEKIIKAYGIYAPSGSMLPTGSRVYLEVAVGPGPAARDQDPEGHIGAGAWVGNVKLGFDVETVDGTAWTQDVNVLGDEEG